MAEIIAITSKPQFEEIIKSNEKVFVDFKAEWCGPCKMLHPVVQQLASETQGVTFIEVDVDQNRDLAMEYQIMSIPTLIVFENGKPTKKGMGFMPMAQLKEMIK